MCCGLLSSLTFHPKRESPCFGHLTAWLISLYVLCRHGAQGVLDTASKATLENEFGTSHDDEVITKILEVGEVQNTEVCDGLPAFSLAVLLRGKEEDVWC